MATKTKDGLGFDFHFSDLDDCLFLYGLEGYAVWKAYNQANPPRMNCKITGIDEKTDTVYIGPPDGY